MRYAAQPWKSRVALLDDINDIIGSGPFASQELRTWDDRPQTSWTSRSGGPLATCSTWHPTGSMAGEGAASRRTVELLGPVAFDDGRHGVPRLLRALNVADENGEAIWNISDFYSVRLLDLQRAAAAGLLPGDPNRIYLVRETTAGTHGGDSDVWHTLIEILGVLDETLEPLIKAGGAAAALEALWRLYKKGSSAIRKQGPGSTSETQHRARCRTCWQAKHGAHRNSPNSLAATPKTLKRLPPSSG